ncbi:MAG: Na+/H+ antiporter subunit G [Cereibacter sphaeroides]|uniref:Na+/H+ antiporter subunit G n=1 Tax=Cereibacter sphaeroides TaxID=1063 RepID=A0A2W5S188_CERSP|nr:MAG: Na+/H+ antiporter subunit G [Cereibacter sphaeroides]
MIIEILISALLVIGGIFGLTGSFGLLKLDNPMKRLHAPTKATTVGVGTALIVSMLYFSIHRQQIAWQELLIVLFLLLSAPITAHFLSKAHLHRNVQAKDLPPTGTGRKWATLDAENTGQD